MQTPADEDGGVTLSSGNVYADLGLPDPELMLAKAQLVRRIEMAVEAGGLPPAAAAERLGLTPARYAALVRGRFRAYSVDRLVRMLAGLGRRVEISVSDA